MPALATCFRFVSILFLLLMLLVACGDSKRDTVQQEHLTVTREGEGLVVSSSGLNCGSVCEASVAKGSSVTLTATPAVGWTFKTWQGGCTGTETTCTLTMNSPRVVTAVFARAVGGPPSGFHRLAVAMTGSGTVTSSPEGIDCDASEKDCWANFQEGAIVTLTATPASDASLVGWQGCDSVGSRVCFVEMAHEKEVILTLEPPQYTLRVETQGDGQGRITSSHGGIDCAYTCSETFPDVTTVTLTAIPEEGSVFAGWSEGCESVSDNQCIVTLTQPRMVKAIFSLPPAPGFFDLTVSKTGEGEGTITSEPAGIDCGEICNYSFPKGTQVILTARAAEGSHPNGWEGCEQETIDQCAVTMDQAHLVTLNFHRNYRSLEIRNALLSTGTGRVTSSPEGINCGYRLYDCHGVFPHGQLVTLTATPDEKSAFVSWEGACTGTSPTCEVVMDDSKTVWARFDFHDPTAQNFNMRIEPDYLLLPHGGTGTVTIHIDRINGFSEPVELHWYFGGDLKGSIEDKRIRGTSATFTVTHRGSSVEAISLTGYLEGRSRTFTRRALFTWEVAGVPTYNLFVENGATTSPWIVPVLVGVQGYERRVEVIARRKYGFDEDITLTVSGLPAGVSASPLILRAGEEAGTITLLTSPTARTGGPYEVVFTSTTPGGLNRSIPAQFWLHGHSGFFDLSYGQNGVSKVMIPEPGGTKNRGDTTAMRLTRLKDGRFLVGGRSTNVINGNWDIFLARFLPDTTLDGFFGNNGIVLDVSPTGQQHFTDMVVQDDGKILVSSYNIEGTYVVSRYLEDGRLDRGFGSSGRAGNPVFTVVKSVAVQPDGRILVLGMVTQGEGNDWYGLVALARYLTDGTIDATFGDQGTLVLDLGLSVMPTRLVVQEDGKLLVSATGLTGPGTWEDYVVVRLHPEGRLDDSFGKGGVVSLDFQGGQDLLHDVLRLSNNDLLLIGSAGGRNVDFGLVRLRPDGTLRESFGNKGKVLTDCTRSPQVVFNSSDDSSDGAYAAVEQPGGKIVVVGAGCRDLQFAVARYHADGSPDAEFGINGITGLAFSETSQAQGVFLQEDEGIIAVGNAYFGTAHSWLSLVRFQP